MRTASRSTGGVAMIDISRTPESANCKVRGIGVAVSVSTWTSARSCLSRSLWPTPKCCSSSTTIRPRSLNLIALPSSAWVPMTMSIAPSAMPFFTFASSFGRDEARGLRDIDRMPAQALGESLGVLARQQRRRHHDGDLLAVHRGDEGGAQRDLGLAEADIAADEPIHRPAGVEIVEHGADGGELILGLLVGKAGAELVVEARGDGEPRRLVQ